MPSRALLLFQTELSLLLFPTIPLCNLRLEESTPTEQKTKHSGGKKQANLCFSAPASFRSHTAGGYSKYARVNL